MAYTVSLYCATQGSCKDQQTIPLNISFAVVLYDELLEGNDGNGENWQGEDSMEDEVVENQSDEAVKYQSDEAAEGHKADETEDLNDLAIKDLYNIPVKEQDEDD